MKKILIILLSIAGMKAVAQQSETRTVEPFTKIELTSRGNLILRQDPAQSVRVENKKGDVHEVQTLVKNGKLLIDAADNSTIYVSAPGIDEVRICGYATAQSDSVIRGENVSLVILGSGTITMQVDVKNLRADISGYGKINLKGNAENVNMEISGDGKINALDLKTKTCNADISGVGKCLVDVSENLNARISGSGKVQYKTKPANVIQDISGIGKIGEFNASSSDSTKISFGKNDFIFTANKSDDDDNDNDSLHSKKHTHGVHPYWAGIEIGLNNYVNAQNKFEVPDGSTFLELNEGKSIAFAINPIDINVNLIGKWCWFSSGFGLLWNNYRFNKSVILDPDSKPVSATIDSIDYIKSKLTVSYLTAPLMIQFFTSRNSKKAFHIGGGLVFAYKLASHSKRKFDNGDSTEKIKTFDDFNLNPFRYSARAVIGYKGVNLFADYAMSSLFRKGGGPELHPVEIGLTLIPF